jgi:uncharacterized protein YndB with AHSA1/START domain
VITVDWALTIGRLPADVFRHVTDVERYPDWQRATGITAVERLEAEPLGDGSRFRMERVVRGNHGHVDCTVTIFAPDTRFAFKGHDSAGFDLETDLRLAPDGAGTRLEWRFTMTTPGLLSLAGGMLRREVRTAAERDFSRLKGLLEQVA